MDTLAIVFFLFSSLIDWNGELWGIDLGQPGDWLDLKRKQAIKIAKQLQMCFYYEELFFLLLFIAENNNFISLLFVFFVSFLYAVVRQLRCEKKRIHKLWSSNIIA